MTKAAASTRFLVTAITFVLGLTIISGCSTNDSDTENNSLAPSSSSTSTSTSTTTSTSTSNGASTPGPKTPPCGNYEVTKLEIISGQEFAAGEYQINAMGISCDEVMGETGLFSQFLGLEDNEPLPAPWSYLEGAVGAPKFVSGDAVGFRVQRIAP
ncbi:MAG: hypothetical protein JHC94_08345 [Acidimicrobiia bacterium]|nr:hypothetical protein [Acidimicrobiia bacterium]